MTAGSEFTENCGWSDEQHQVDVSHTTCRDGTFNDGYHIKCQNCRSCLTTQFIACSTTTDTICCKQGYNLLYYYYYLTFNMFTTSFVCSLLFCCCCFAYTKIDLIILTRRLLLIKVFKIESESYGIVLITH